MKKKKIAKGLTKIFVGAGLGITTALLGIMAGAEDLIKGLEK